MVGLTAERKGDCWVELTVVQSAQQKVERSVDVMAASMVARRDWHWVVKRAVRWDIEWAGSMGASWADSKDVWMAAQTADWRAVSLVVRWAGQTGHLRAAPRAESWEPPRAE
jgi:hypothetical protein